MIAGIEKCHAVNFFAASDRFDGARELEVKRHDGYS
jgi:hypothetical protein